MSPLLPPREHRSQSQPSARPGVCTPPPHPGRGHAQSLPPPGGSRLTPCGSRRASVCARRPEAVVALPAAGHSVGHAAARARVRALHDDKGPLFQRGHRQVPAVHHGLQGGTVARPHRVLHVKDAVVPAPHLQRATSLSPGPPALLPPALWAGPACDKDPPPTPREAQSRKSRAWLRSFGEQESRGTGLGMGLEGGLPAPCSPAPVPLLSSPASTRLPALGIFPQPTPSLSPHSLPPSLGMKMLAQHRHCCALIPRSPRHQTHHLKMPQVLLSLCLCQVSPLPVGSYSTFYNPSHMSQLP